MRSLLLITLFVLGTLPAFAQKGEIWPTITRQDFEMNDEGKVSKEYKSEDYYSYYLFINNNEFIHCTNDITSLYKILKRAKTVEGSPKYTVISEANNQYDFVFNKKENYILITNEKKSYGIYATTEAPYTTAVFDNVNR